VKASYWYLEFGDGLTEKPLPNAGETTQQLLQLGKQIKLARQLDRFRCNNGAGGCSACQPLEKILKGEGELVGTTTDGRRDIYILAYGQSDKAIEDESVIL
jgi:hypothetical protein